MGRSVGSVLLACALAAGDPGWAGLPDVPSREDLETAVRGHSYPTAIYLAGPALAESYGAAAAIADPGAGGPLTINTSLRIASNTKTFVAATTLRLHEEGLLDLDANIGPMLTPSLVTLLTKDGYDAGKITVRQLLSHSAGLYDHASDPRFIKTVLQNPTHRWTREELVRLSMSYGDPQSKPGTQFGYSDTGYILLGDIIEQVTREPLAKVVRHMLRFDELGLSDSWWEVVEQPPRGAVRGRQMLGDIDVTNIHASMDLYGGGGLVMSVHDLAIFAEALFGGRVFSRPESVGQMLWQGPHLGSDQYRLGIFVEIVGNCEAYWHSGFWGTVVYYSPTAQVAVAGATTNQQGYGAVRSAVKAIMKSLHDGRDCAANSPGS